VLEQQISKAALANLAIKHSLLFLNHVYHFGPNLLLQLLSHSQVALKTI
jgi:hypothetical protein